MAFGGVQLPRTLLCVNIDHVAALREAGGGNEPDLLEVAAVCKDRGCNGISTHLREDRRHVQERDVFAIKGRIIAKFYLEIGLSDEMIEIAKKVRPDRITIVPEKREETTAEGGLDLGKHISKIRDTVELFRNEDIPVSLFLEPDMETVDICKECGADYIEINTASYCNAAQITEVEGEIDRIYRAADHAVKLGLKVNAGRGLNYRNVVPLLHARELLEVNIGHSIISRSVFVGLAKAVDEMLEVLD